MQWNYKPQESQRLAISDLNMINEMKIGLNSLATLSAMHNMLQS